MTVIRPGIEWPPAPWGTVLTDVAEAAVWWEGTADGLTDYYQRSARRTRPVGLGGRIKAARAAFWGKTEPIGRGGKRLHVPVAADLANTSANLLFSNPPAFTVPGGDQKAQDRLDMIANTTQTHSLLLVAGESAAALSGVFLRVVWDQEVADNAFLDMVDADRAIPEFRWGRMVAVNFWTEYQQDRTIYRHVERYEPGRIVHTLYRGTRDNLGRVVPLDELPDTAWAAGVVDAEGGVETGSDLLAAVYVPNNQPNPRYRTDVQLRNLGRADISRDLIPLMDAVDETYSSLVRDVRLAKARLVVSSNYLTHMGPGAGNAFDLDDEVFEAVNTVPGRDGTAAGTMQAHQFAIRVEEHMQTAEGLVREILRRAGYSPLTFGLTDAVAITAAETAARERTSTTTRQAKTRLWMPQLAKLLRAQVEIDAHQFGTDITVSEDIEVEWSQASQETANERAQTLSLLEQARAASTEVKVRMLHPDWDDEDVQTEAARIQAEAGMMLPDLGGLTEQDYTQPDEQ